MNQDVQDVLSAAFPRAFLYRGEGLVKAGRVREKTRREPQPSFTERHLQCLWFDSALRPSLLRSHQNEEVVVEDPGVWNLEAGPDFWGAAIRLGPDRRRVTGDVEIHIHPADWRHHGHNKDPLYKNVRFHVTYFPGTLPDHEFPPGVIQLSLKNALSSQSNFSFDTIDVTAYPFAARAPTPPCQHELKTWSPDAKKIILEAAGEERLRRKAERMAMDIEEKGADQVLYKEVLTALGYKNNKAPFSLLAHRLTVERLRGFAQQNAMVAYAILLGVSGLLPKTISPRWDKSTKQFVRTLWDIWWKHEQSLGPSVMSRNEWRLAGLRPVNHPARRLMAAAHLFSQKKSLIEFLLPMARKASKTTRDMKSLLQATTGGYWDHRLGFSGKKLTKPVALIGDDRADAMIINIFVPFLAAIGELKPFHTHILQELPPESDNSVVRQTAFNLFGPHHNARVYHNGLGRQGLIQIFHDYCLNDRSRCASCTFPSLLKLYRENTAKAV